MVWLAAEVMKEIISQNSLLVSAVGAAAALNSSEIAAAMIGPRATEQNAEDWERFEGRINALADGNALLKAAKYADANAKYTAAIDLCSGCFEFMRR